MRFLKILKMVGIDSRLWYDNPETDRSRRHECI